MGKKRRDVLEAKIRFRPYLTLEEIEAEGEEAWITGIFWEFPPNPRCNNAAGLLPGKVGPGNNSETKNTALKVSREPLVQVPHSRWCFSSLFTLHFPFFFFLFFSRAAMHKQN